MSNELTTLRKPHLLMADELKFEIADVLRFRTRQIVEEDPKPSLSIGFSKIRDSSLTASVDRVW
jgi:hypothetical protein